VGFKGSPNPSHLFFEINVGKGRMMNLKIGSKSIEDDIIQIQNRYLSDPLLSDVDFKNKMVLV